MEENIDKQTNVIKHEGDLTRDLGPNSIKSVKTLLNKKFDDVSGVLLSINKSVSKQVKTLDKMASMDKARIVQAQEKEEDTAREEAFRKEDDYTYDEIAKGTFLADVATSLREAIGGMLSKFRSFLKETKFGKLLKGMAVIGGLGFVGIPFIQGFLKEAFGFDFKTESQNLWKKVKDSAMDLGEFAKELKKFTPSLEKINKRLQYVAEATGPLDFINRIFENMNEVKDGQTTMVDKVVAAVGATLATTFGITAAKRAYGASAQAAPMAAGATGAAPKGFFGKAVGTVARLPGIFAGATLGQELASQLGEYLDLRPIGQFLTESIGGGVGAYTGFKAQEYLIQKMMGKIGITGLFKSGFKGLAGTPALAATLSLTPTAAGLGSTSAEQINPLLDQVKDIEEFKKKFPEIFSAYGEDLIKSLMEEREFLKKESRKEFESFKKESAEKFVDTGMIIKGAKADLTGAIQRQKVSDAINYLRKTPAETATSIVNSFNTVAPQDNRKNSVVAGGSGGSSGPQSITVYDFSSNHMIGQGTMN